MAKRNIENWVVEFFPFSSRKEDKKPGYEGSTKYMVSFSHLHVMQYKIMLVFSKSLLLMHPSYKYMYYDHFLRSNLQKPMEDQQEMSNKVQPYPHLRFWTEKKIWTNSKADVGKN